MKGILKKISIAALALILAFVMAVPAMAEDILAGEHYIRANQDYFGDGDDPMDNGNITEYGGTCRLLVDIWSSDISDLTFEWYRDGVKVDDPDYTVRINTLDNASVILNTTPIYTKTTYTCVITSPYTSAAVDLEAFVISGFSLDYDSDSEITVSEGDTAELAVKPQPEDAQGISYQWYKKLEQIWYLDEDTDEWYYLPGEDGKWHPMEGENDRVLRTAVYKNTSFKCEATDSSGNKDSKEFNVCINNNLTAFVSGTTKTKEVYFAGFGDDIVLSADVTANDMTGITYDWYNGTNHDLLSYGTGLNTYTAAAVTEDSKYYVEVRDRFGGKKRVEFEVHVEVPELIPGETVRVPVKGLSQYFKFIPPADGNYEFVPLSDCQYYIVFDENMTEIFRCDFNYSDDIICGLESGHVYYLKEESLLSDEEEYFEAGVYKCNDNQLTLEYASKKSATIEAGENATFAVTAHALDETDITYCWECDGQVIPGANLPSYTAEGVDCNSDFQCIATDRFGYSTYLDFYVRIKGDFYMFAPGEYAGRPKAYLVNTGDDVELKVLTGGSLEGVTFEWYRYALNEPDGTMWISAASKKIEGAETTILNVENVTSFEHYYCTARDSYGNEETVHFKIYPAEGVRTLKEDTPVDVCFTRDAPAYLYEFTPAVTGNYLFTANDDEGDFIVWVYDENFRYQEGGWSTGEMNRYDMVFEKGHKYYFSAEGGDEFSDEITFNAVLKMEIDIADAVIAISSQTYTGSKLTPAPTVKYGTKKLVKGRDYTVRYSNNINAGTARATITGIGTCKGEAVKSFKINPASLAAAKVTAASQTFAGKALTPAPTVKLGTRTLKKGTDYTVKYSSNTRVGTATVTVTGKGNYKGTAKGSFKIQKAANPMVVKSSAKSVLYTKVKSAKQTVAPISVTNARGTVTYTKVSGAKQLTVNKTTGKITVAKGTKKQTYKARIRVSASGSDNYKGKNYTVTVQVTVK